MKPVVATAVAAVVIAAGIFATFRFHNVIEPGLYPSPRERIDDRFREVRAALPADAELGWFTDVPPTETHYQVLRLQAPYALAPKLIIVGGPARYAIADLHDPRNLGEVCRRAGMVPVVVGRGGRVALLRREREP